MKTKLASINAGVISKSQRQRRATVESSRQDEFFLLSLHSSEARLAAFGCTKMSFVVSPLRWICCTAETLRFGLIKAAMGGEAAPLTAVLGRAARC